MILLDVNVVLAAHRADHPHHQAVRPWFDELVSSEQAFAVPDAVWASFVRLATHPRIFDVPTPIRDVFAFLRATRGQPNHVVAVPGERHLEIFEGLCTRNDATGDLVPDAYLAAVAIEQGWMLASFDRDFARFDELQWVVPGQD